MKKLRIFFLILGGIFVLGVAWRTGNSLYLFEGFPKGVDAYAHMTRIAWILKYFPQINWNPFWDSGTPFWIWTYPPLTALLSAGVIKVFSISVEQGMILTGAFLMLLGILGLYAACYLISRRIMIAIFVTVLTVTTPAFWSWWGHGGNYARIWGTAFYFWAFAFLVWYLRQPSRWRFFFLVLCTSLAVSSHLLYGGLTLLTFGAYLLFAVQGLRKKILTGLKILIPAFLLAAYWYFPLLLTSKPGGRFIEGAFGGPVTFQDLFFLDPKRVFFTLPVQFTLIVLGAVVLAIILLILKRYQERLVKAVILGLGLAVLGTLFYILIGNLPNYPEKGYLAVFPPFATLPVLVFFSAYFLAGVFSGFPRWVAIITSGVLTVLVITLFVFNLPFERKSIYDVSRPGNPQVTAQALTTKLPLNRDYRFGTDSAFVADWFNYLYPDLLQSRDYIYQGIPFKQWQFWFEWLIWTQPENFTETQYLLDWYGVKYFSVGFASVNTQYEKFLNHPEFFTQEQTSEEESFYLFSYNEATPIASFPKVPTLLMIGGKTEFEAVFRTLAVSGYGTRKIIPVWGGEKLALPADELRQFDIVFLYNYRAKNLEVAVKPLVEFVRQGGVLLIESQRTVETNEELSQLPDPFPIIEVDTEERKGEWGLDRALDFAPAVFGNDSWKVNIASQIKPWGRVMLSSFGKPVIVEGDFDKGKVIWSGINLPYHALANQNKTETDYFIGLLELGLGKSLTEQKEEEVNFTLWEPEKRIIETTKEQKGILLKESHFPQWHAYLQQTTKDLKIYTTGPNLMYIPLPKKTVASEKVVLDYQISIIEKLGWLTSLATIILLILNLKGKIPKFFTHLERFNLKSWWEKEEEF